MTIGPVRSCWLLDPWVSTAFGLYRVPAQITVNGRTGSEGAGDVGVDSLHLRAQRVGRGSAADQLREATVHQWLALQASGLRARKDETARGGHRQARLSKLVPTAVARL